MPLSQLPNVKVRNRNLGPSQLYAVSPYRPTALLTQGPNNPFSNQLQNIILRATNPFQMGSKETLEHIRYYENIRSNNSYYNTIGILGGISGAATAGLLTLDKTISAITAANAATIAYTSAGTATASAGAAASVSVWVPILGWVIAAGAIAFMATSMITGYKVGKTAAQMALTKEGHFFSAQYAKNLGNSMVNRPITTLLQTGLAVGNMALNRYVPAYSTFNPMIKTPLYMSASRGIHTLGGEIDKALFGEMDQYQQISYTTLSAIRGDIYDMRKGNPFLRGAIKGIIDWGKEDVEKTAIQKISAAYGLGEEEYDPFRFADLRQDMNIDLGTFTNGIVDMIGELVLDTGTIGVAIKTPIKNKVVKSGLKNLVEEIKKYPNSELFKLLYTVEETKEYKEHKKVADEELSKYEEKIQNDINDYVTKNEKTNLTTDDKKAKLQKLPIKKLRELSEKNKIPNYKKLTKKQMIEKLSGTKDGKPILDTKTILTEERTNYHSRKLNSKRKEIEERKNTFDNKGSYKETDLGRLFIGNKGRGMLKKMLSEYYSKYVAPIGSNKRKERAIKNNDRVIMELVNKFAHSLSGNKDLDLSGINMSALRDQLTYMFEANIADLFRDIKGGLETIHDDLLKIRYDLDKKKQNSAFYHFGFSFDGTLTETFLENQRGMSDRFAANMLLLNSEARFFYAGPNKTGKLEKFENIMSQAGNFFVDPMRTITGFLMNSSIRRMKRTLNNFTSEVLTKKIEELKKLRVDISDSLDDLIKTAEELDNRIKQGIENRNIALRNFVTSDKVKEINEKLKNLKETLDKEKVDGNQDTINEIMEDIEKFETQLKDDRSKYIKEKMEKDPNFKTFMEQIESLQKRINSHISYIAYITSLDSPVNIGRSKLSKDKQTVNSSNIKELQERFVELENMNRNKSEDEEYYNLQYALQTYINIQLDRSYLKRIASLQHEIHNFSIDGELDIINTVYSIQGMTTRLFKYKDDEVLNGVTYNGYLEALEKTPEEIEKIRNKKRKTLEDKTILKIIDKKDELTEMFDILRNRTTEATEEDVRANKELERMLYDKPIVELDDDFLLEMLIDVNLPTSVKNKILDVIKNNKKVELKLNYATEIFTVINNKVLDGEEGVKRRFVLNNPEFFDLIEEELTKEDSKFQPLLKRLSEYLTYDTIEKVRSFRNKYTSIEENEQIKKDLKELQELLGVLIKKSGETKIKMNNADGIETEVQLLDESEIAYLLDPQKNNLLYIAMGLISTHKTMNYSGEKGDKTKGTYEVDLVNLTENQVTDWILDMLTEDETYKSRMDHIDSLIMQLNQTLQDAAEDLLKDKEENLLTESTIMKMLNKETINIYTSKTLNAISARYQRFGAMKEFKELKIAPFDHVGFKYTPQEIVKINNYTAKYKSELLKTNFLETFRNQIYKTTIDMYGESKGQEIFETYDINEDTLFEAMFEGVIINQEDEVYKVNEKGEVKFGEETLNKEDFEEKFVDKNIIWRDGEVVVKDYKTTEQKYKELADVLWQKINDNKLVSDEAILQKEEKFKKEITQKFLLLTEMAKYVAIEEIRKGVDQQKDRSDDQASVLANFIKDIGLGDILEIDMIHQLLRGEIHISSTQVNFDKGQKEDPDSNYYFIKNFFKSTRPSLEAIEKLKSNKGDFVFTNLQGHELRIVSLNQFRNSGLLTPEWIDLITDEITEIRKSSDSDEIVSELDFATLSFAKGLPLNVTENLQEKWLRTQYTIPSRIRDDRKEFKGEENFISFFRQGEEYSQSHKKTLNNFKKQIEGTIAEDFMLSIERINETNNLISNASISKQVFTVKLEEDGPETKYRILKLGIVIGQDKNNNPIISQKEIYIPEAEERKIAFGNHKISDIYNIDGSRLIRVGTALEKEKSTQYLNNIIEDITNEIRYVFGNIEDQLDSKGNVIKTSQQLKKEYQLKLSQKSFMNIFFDRRTSSVLGTDEEVSDFMLLTENKTEYQELFYSLVERLPENVSNLAVDDNKRFVSMIDSHKIAINGKLVPKYNYKMVSTSANMIMKNIIIYDNKGNAIDYKTPHELLMVFGNSMGETQRSVYPLNTMKSTIESLEELQARFGEEKAKGMKHGFLKHEMPVVLSKEFQSEHFKGLEKYANIGVNLRTKLVDLSFLIKDGTLGITNYEDAAIMPASIARERFGDKNDIKEYNGFKIINRHSAKQSIIVVDDEILMKHFEVGADELHEIYISKHSSQKRKLYSMYGELAASKNATEENPVYIDNNKTILDNGVNDLNVDEGLMYFYLTDNLEHGHNAIGDFDESGNKGERGIVLGVEEIFTMLSTSSIRYNSKNEKGKTVERILDPNQEMADWIFKRSISKMETQSREQAQQTGETYQKVISDMFSESITELSGKRGVVKSSFMRRIMPNSAYNLILPDSSLTGNKVKISYALASQMGLYNVEKEEWTHEHANKGVILRYPTQGRRSFIYVEYELSDDVSEHTMMLSLSMHKLLNADHDGDRMAHFSLKGIEEGTRKLFEKSFSHEYEEYFNFSDNRFHKIISEEDFEEESNTKRDVKEIFKGDTTIDENEEKEFFEKGLTHMIDEEEFKHSFEKQKNLKAYSGLLTGLFDSQDQMYEENPANKEWFNSLFIKENYKKLSQEEKDIREILLKYQIKDFPSLTTMLKDFFSQKTFDFAKHGSEEHRLSFQHFYKSAKRLRGESFQEHIIKLVLATDIVIEANKTLKENLTKDKPMEEKEALKLFEEELKNQFELQDGKENFASKYNQKIIDDRIQEEQEDYVRNLFKTSSSKTEKTEENKSINVIKKELVDKIKNIMPELDGMSFDEIVNTLELTDEMLESSMNELGRNIYVENGFEVKRKVEAEGITYEGNIFRQIYEIIEQGLEGISTKARKGSEIIKLGRVFKNGLINAISEVNLINSNIAKDLIMITYDRYGRKKEIPLISLIKAVNGQNKIDIDHKNYYKFLTPNNIRKFSFVADLTKMNLFDEDLRTFEIASASGSISRRTLKKINEKLGNDLDKEIYDFMYRSGKGTVMALTPLLYGKVAFDSKQFHQLFIDMKDLIDKTYFDKDITKNRTAFSIMISGYEENGELNETGKAFAEEIITALSGTLTFNTFAKFITEKEEDGGYINNIIRKIFQYEKMFMNSNIDEKITIDSLKDLLLRYNMIVDYTKDRKNYELSHVHDTKDLVNSFYKMINQTDEDLDFDSEIGIQTINKMFNIIMDFADALNIGDYNMVNDFFLLSTEEKLNYLAKTQIVRDDMDKILNEKNDENGEAIKPKLLFFDREEVKDLKINFIDFSVDRNFNLLDRGDYNKIFNLYDKAIKGINTPGLSSSSKTKLAEGLDMEKQSIQTLSKIIKVMGKNIKQTYIDFAKLANKTGVSEERIRYLANPDNNLPQVLYFAKTKQEKTSRKITQRLSKYYLKPYDRDGSQTYLSEWGRLQNEDVKIYNELLHLYAFYNNSNGQEENLRNYILNLEGTISGLTTYPVHRGILEHTLNLNKLLLSLVDANIINKNSVKVILPGTLERFFRSIVQRLNIENLDSIITEKGDLDLKRFTNRASVFGQEYRHAILNLKSNARDEDVKKLENIKNAETEILNFFMRNSNITKFNLGSEEYIELLFGMLIYDDQVLPDNLIEIEGSIVDVREKRFNQLLEERRIINQIKSERIFLQSSEMVNIIIENDFNDEELKNFLLEKGASEEVIKNIEEKLMAYNSLRQIDIELGKIDTYEIVRGINNKLPSGEFLQFPKKSLYAVFDKLYQVLGKERFGNSDLASKDFAEKIEKMKKDFILSNPKLHTAAVDIYMNYEVVLLFAELFKNSTPEEIKKSLGNIPESEAKAFINFLNNDQRKNYVIMDSETLIVDENRYLANKIYEISYIIFNESGVPEIKQRFLINKIDRDVEAFLTSKGYTKDEIRNIQENISKNQFGHNKKVMDELFGDLYIDGKQKQVIGHFVTGDMEDINEQYKHVYRKEILDEVHKFNISNQEVIKNLNEMNSSNMATYISEQLSFEENESRLNWEESIKDKDLIKSMVEIMIDKFVSEVEEYLMWEDQSFNENEKENYKVLTYNLMEGFIRSTSGAELKEYFKNSMNEYSRDKNYKYDISDEDAQLILDEFNKELLAIKNEGTHLLTIPKLDIVDGRLKLHKNYADKESSFYKLENEGNEFDQFTQQMFRIRAFEKVFPLIKNSMMYSGLSYNQIQYHTLSTSKINDDFINIAENSDNENIREHWNLYKEANKNKDLYSEVHNLRKVVSLIESDTLVDLFGDEFLSSTMKFNKMDLNKEQQAKYIQISDKEIEYYTDTLLTNELNKLFGEEIKDPKTRSLITSISWRLSTIINPTVDDFIELFNLPGSDNEFARLIFNAWQDNYNKLKRDGIKFNLPLNVPRTAKDIVKYETNKDRLFKQIALSSLIAGYAEDNEYLGRYLKAAIKNTTLELTEYEKNELGIRADEIYDGLKFTKINERPENKNLFNTARRDFKNMIIQSIINNDWSSVYKYMKKNPARDVNLETYFDQFKLKVIETLDKLKQEGIKYKKTELNIGNDMRLKYTIELDKVLNWNDIKGNEGLEFEFYKEVLNILFEEINEELYVEQIFLTKDTIPAKKIVRYKEYLFDINNYGGEKFESDFDKQYEHRDTIKNATKVFRERKNRIEDLQRLQINFYDIIESFRNIRTGEIDIELLKHSLTKGYLSKTYAVTFISELTEAEELKAKDKLDKKRAERIGALKQLESMATGEVIDDLTDEDLLNRYGDDKGIIEQVVNSPFPVLRKLDIEAEGVLEFLLELYEKDKEGLLGIGLTTIPNLIEANKGDYRNQELPKHIAKLQNTVVKMQKFIATSNPGFFAKMMYNNLIKNYIAIMGTDEPIYNNYRFAKEAIRATHLDSYYNNATVSKKMLLGDLTNIFKTLNNINEKGIDLGFDLNSLDDAKENIEVFIANGLSNLTYFLENIIPDQATTEYQISSALYQEIRKAELLLTSFKERLEKVTLNSSKDSYFEIKSVAVGLFNLYNNLSYQTETVLGITKNDSHFNLVDNSNENRRDVLDKLNLMYLINRAENAGLMYTDFHLNGRKDISEIYNIIKKKTAEEAYKTLTEKGIDWIVNGPIGTPRKRLLNTISRHGRIHGLLLDTYVNNLSPDEAISESIFRFFNMGMRSQTERELAIFFPFMSYAIRDLEYQLEMMTNPKYMEFMANIAQGMETWFKGDEDEDETLSYNYIHAESNRGWVPLGRNFGIKLDFPMFRSLNILSDPFEAAYQRANPIIKSINDWSKSGELNWRQLGSGTVGRMADVINTISGGNYESPADIMPSLFYRRYPGDKGQYVPYKYRVNYDYRNLNRELFFQDGSRRKPSLNPYTTTKNILYQARVNASINRHMRNR